MRTIIRNTLLAVTASVVAMGVLSGCSSSHEGSFEGPPAPIPSETPYVYFNTETGQITKITDEAGETTYENGASSEDSRTPHSASNPASNYPLERSITLEGKPYTVETSIGLSMTPEGREGLIAFYNEHIAAPRLDTQPPAPSFSLWGETLEFVEAQIRAGEEAGQLSSLQVRPTGEVERKTDTRVADAWRSGMPAWQAGEMFGDSSSYYSSPNSNTPGSYSNFEPEYYYSFYCATYGVELTGKEEAMNWLNSLVGTQFVSLSINGSSSKEVSVETPEPCKMYAEYPESTPPNDTPPEPPYPGDGYGYYEG